MKLAEFLGMALFFAAMPMAAQAPYNVPVPPSFGVARMEPMDTNGTSSEAVSRPNPCPVRLQARHLPDGSMRNTGSTAGHQHAKIYGQALRLSFTAPEERALASATLQVRGWTAGGHLQPVADEKPRAVRTLQIPLKGGSGHIVSADLWVPGLTAVEIIELVSATYADGTTWKPSADTRCQVRPELRMLVSRP